MRPASWVAALTVVAWAGAAQAFSVSTTGGTGGDVIRWKKSALTYALHPAGSADITDGSDLQTVRAAFQQWQGVACTAVTFTEKPGSTNLALTALNYGTNGVNEIAWIETSAWGYGAYVLGITAPVFYSDGSIIEADIALNGYQQKWSTKGASGAADVASTVLHEQGHFFGLSHVLYGFAPQDPPTMAPTVDPNGKTASLTADDQAGVCYLYPKGAGGCTSGADCPYLVDDNAQGEFYAGKIDCQGGLCGGVSNQLPEGAQALGEACTSKYDCKDDGAFCQIQGSSGGTCAVECASPQTNDCPSGLVCVGYSNAAGGVCLPKTGEPPPSKANGAPCTYGNECKSLLCVGSSGASKCRQKCALGDDASCGAGFVCAQIQGQAYGACIEGDSPTLKGAGEACAGGQECASGLCVGLTSVAYACADPCGAGGSCAEGFACAPLTGGGGACLPTGDLGELGATCEFNTDCKSDICIKVTGPNAPADPFCTQACGACPCGMECVEFVGGESFCEPTAKVACVPTGIPCGASSECIGGVCDGGVCADTCSVVAPDCAPGLACRPLDGTGGVCDTPGSGPAGAPCAADADCATLYCGETAEGAVCLVPCNPAHPVACGDAFACEGAGSIGGCVAVPPGEDVGGVDAGSVDGTGADVGGSGSGDAGGAGSGDAGSGDAGSGDVAPGGAADVGVGGSSAASSGGCAAAPGAGAPSWALLMLALAWVRRRWPATAGVIFGRRTRAAGSHPAG